MNVVEINRQSNFTHNYYGVVKLEYDEITVISNALYRLKKNKDLESTKMGDVLSSLYSRWEDFRLMTCYGVIVDKDDSDDSMNT